MNSKLQWKQKWCDDKSGYWYSAKVPFLNWEYIIDVQCCDKIQKVESEKAINQECFNPGVYYGKYDSDPSFLAKTPYKTPMRAMKACEDHLLKTVNNLKNWANNNL